MSSFTYKPIKQTLREEIKYVTREDAAEYVFTVNLMEEGEKGPDYASQCMAVERIYEKVPKKGETRCYDFILGPTPEDSPDPEKVLNFAEDVACEFFSDYQVVAAVHTNTGIPHAHIVVNAINLLTGNKLNMSDAAYFKMRDWVDEVGEKKYGFSKWDPCRNSDNSYNKADREQMKKGAETGPRWDLRRFVTVNTGVAVSEDDFFRLMDEDGVAVESSKDGKDYVYRMTGLTYRKTGKPLRFRGSTLGRLYTKDHVLSVIAKRERASRTETFPDGIPVEDTANHEEGFFAETGVALNEGTAARNAEGSREKEKVREFSDGRESHAVPEGAAKSAGKAERFETGPKSPTAEAGVVEGGKRREDFGEQLSFDFYETFAVRRGTADETSTEETHSDETAEASSEDGSFADAEKRCEEAERSAVTGERTGSVTRDAPKGEATAEETYFGGETDFSREVGYSKDGSVAYGDTEEWLLFEFYEGTATGDRETGKDARFDGDEKELSEDAAQGDAEEARDAAEERAFCVERENPAVQGGAAEVSAGKKTLFDGGAAPSPEDEHYCREGEIVREKTGVRPLSGEGEGPVTQCVPKGEAPTEETYFGGESGFSREEGYSKDGGVTYEDTEEWLLFEFYEGTAAGDGKAGKDARFDWDEKEPSEDACREDLGIAHEDTGKRLYLEAEENPAPPDVAKADFASEETRFDGGADSNPKEEHCEDAESGYEDPLALLIARLRSFRVEPEETTDEEVSKKASFDTDEKSLHTDARCEDDGREEADVRLPAGEGGGFAMPGAPRGEAFGEKAHVYADAEPMPGDECFAGGESGCEKSEARPSDRVSGTGVVFGGSAGAAPTVRGEEIRGKGSESVAEKSEPERAEEVFFADKDVFTHVSFGEKTKPVSADEAAERRRMESGAYRENLRPAESGAYRETYVFPEDEDFPEETGGATGNFLSGMMGMVSKGLGKVAKAAKRVFAKDGKEDESGAKKEPLAGDGSRGGKTGRVFSEKGAASFSGEKTASGKAAFWGPETSEREEGTQTRGEEPLDAPSFGGGAAAEDGKSEEREFFERVRAVTVRFDENRPMGSVYEVNPYTFCDIWADYARHELSCGRSPLLINEYAETVNALLESGGGSVKRVREKIRFNPPKEYIPSAFGGQKKERDEMLLRLHGGEGIGEYMRGVVRPHGEENVKMETRLKRAGQKTVEKSEAERKGSQNYNDGK